MGPPIRTNSIDVTHDCGPKIKAAFTNGILSTQNLVRQLQSVRKGPTKAVLADAASKDSTKRAKGAHEKEAHLLSVLKSEIKTKGSSIRNFLRGDVYAFLSALIDRAEVEGGQVYFALYELDDVELVPLLVDAMKRKLVHVILSTASSFDPNPKGTPKDQRKPIVWDVENDAARALLKAAAGKEKTRIIDPDVQFNRPNRGTTSSRSTSRMKRRSRFLPEARTGPATACVRNPTTRSSSKTTA